MVMRQGGVQSAEREPRSCDPSSNLEPCVDKSRSTFMSLAHYGLWLGTEGPSVESAVPCAGALWWGLILVGAHKPIRISDVMSTYCVRCGKRGANLFARGRFWHIGCFRGTWSVEPEQ